MSLGFRGARAAARPLRSSIRRQPRRYAGHEAGHGHEGAQHGESALHVAGGSGTESFGRGFWISIATVPFAALVYSIASSPGDNALSRLVKKYEAGKADDERANVIHTTMMEAAAADRQLFAATARDESGPSLRNPELFNAGSPWNVSAGQSADLSGLTKFYEERNKEAEEERIRRLKKANGVSVYD